MIGALEGEEWVDRRSIELDNEAILSVTYPCFGMTLRRDADKIIIFRCHRVMAVAIVEAQRAEAWK